MTSVYRLQERVMIGRTDNGKPRLSAWRTVRTEPADEHGGARAERWLLSQPGGPYDKRRLRFSGFTLTREQCAAAHAAKAT